MDDVALFILKLPGNNDHKVTDDHPLPSLQFTRDAGHSFDTIEALHGHPAAPEHLLDEAKHFTVPFLRYTDANNLLRLLLSLHFSPFLPFSAPSLLASPRPASPSRTPRTSTLGRRSRRLSETFKFELRDR